MGIVKLFTLTQFYSLSLFFFFFSRKGMKMDLLITISILCFVSLVAGTPASDGVKDDFADEPQVKRKTPVRKTARMLFESALGGRRMEEANCRADQRLLPDFANAEIRRDTRMTCQGPGEDCGWMAPGK